jgi:hypothetical protein
LNARRTMFLSVSLLWLFLIFASTFLPLDFG